MDDALGNTPNPSSAVSFASECDANCYMEYEGSRNMLSGIEVTGKAETGDTCEEIYRNMQAVEYQKILDGAYPDSEKEKLTSSDLWVQDIELIEDENEIQDMESTWEEQCNICSGGPAAPISSVMPINSSEESQSPSSNENTGSTSTLNPTSTPGEETSVEPTSTPVESDTPIPKTVAPSENDEGPSPTPTPTPTATATEEAGTKPTPTPATTEKTTEEPTPTPDEGDAGISVTSAPPIDGENAEVSGSESNSEEIGKQTVDENREGSSYRPEPFIAAALIMLVLA